ELTRITATFNASDQLLGLIDSLRAQSDRNFEWIVVDGASTDATIDLLKASKDVVSTWISEPDFGIYDALNKGIRLSTNDYYLVLGADDRLLPDAIAQYRGHAAISGADLVTASILLEGRISKGRRGRSWWNGMFAYVSGHSVGTLIKRSLHDRIGYYSRRFPVAADMYFIKTACMSPNVRVHLADFVAGEHGKAGISSVDKAATFCDCFRVQLETERWKLPQIMIFLAKLIWRIGDLKKSSRNTIDCH
ncbi:MAG TPA: glycosyltransferase, partial [Gemmatales bacterium]|nr:glycosyltransferase [Gemmatales bacterium]